MGWRSWDPFVTRTGEVVIYRPGPVMAPAPVDVDALTPAQERAAKIVALCIAFERDHPVRLPFT
jgi:hypothetical protein